MLRNCYNWKWIRPQATPGAHRPRSQERERFFWALEALFLNAKHLSQHPADAPTRHAYMHTSRIRTHDPRPSREKSRVSSRTSSRIPPAFFPALYPAFHPAFKILCVSFLGIFQWLLPIPRHCVWWWGHGICQMLELFSASSSASSRELAFLFLLWLIF